jgi:hypothetical protein
MNTIYFYPNNKNVFEPALGCSPAMGEAPAENENKYLVPTVIIGVGTVLAALYLTNDAMGPKNVRKKKGVDGIKETLAEAGKNALVTKLVVGGAAIGAGYFLVVKPILQKVGVIQTKEEKEQEKQTETFASSLQSPFSPRYYKEITAQLAAQKKDPLLITRASAQQLAKIIYDAIGFFSDDENAVYGALRQLKAKTQLSFLSEVFFTQHKADLYNYLERNFKSSELKVVNDIANALKPY